MIGVVTVDDLLEELLPQGWRREFGMTCGGGVIVRRLVQGHVQRGSL